jgi:hypothetical protein
VRAPKGSGDQGLYLVRSRDGISRCAVRRGVLLAPRLRVHLVSAVTDAGTIGTELRTFWPSHRPFTPGYPGDVVVGDFLAALQFACCTAATVAREHGIPLEVPHE